MQSTQQKDPPKTESISQTWDSRPSDHVLSSWKEIAAFFGKGVRTVQRWERELGLPVRRPNGDKQIVFAKVQELQSWLSRHSARARNDAQDARYDHRNSDEKILQQFEAMSLDDLQRIKELAERIQELAERAARSNRKAS